MKIELSSPCKVNLLLNILGRRADGFHELETLMQPVGLCDLIVMEPTSQEVALTCNREDLPTDSTNLVHRAATAFLGAAGLRKGARIHLEKRVPMAAGLGGGSANAATTLLGLNRVFGHPLQPEKLTELAAGLGSDVPFFLQEAPALCTGRGERIESLQPFAALQGLSVLLIHPGFGIATAWAYRELVRHPEALNGRPGRARRLADLLGTGDLTSAKSEFYNSLEAPAFHKYPVLALYQEFLLSEGAVATLMSGSGSTTFALVKDRQAGENLGDRFRARFGDVCWTTVVPLHGCP
jgi:4-diphosphocytidyl-2-C-methyl-D-erythritol kinase